MRAIVRQFDCDELIMEIPIGERWLEADYINLFIAPPVDWSEFKPTDAVEENTIRLRHIGFDERDREVLPILQQIK